MSLTAALLSPAHAQPAPYGARETGASPGAVVGAHVGGSTCSRTIVGPDGTWLIDVSTGDICAPNDGDEITFTLNGEEVGETVTWTARGTPVGSGFDAGIGVTLTVASPAGVAAVPPPGGLTIAVAGASRLEALIDAQPFVVESVWVLDVGTQQFLRDVPGAPGFANTLLRIVPTDIVMLKSS